VEISKLKIYHAFLDVIQYVSTRFIEMQNVRRAIIMKQVLFGIMNGTSQRWWPHTRRTLCFRLF